MLYKESPFAVIEWDEGDRIASIVWRAYVDGDDYRNMLLALTELIEQKSTGRLLADSRKAKVVAPEDQAWVNTVWTPLANKVGLKYSALLVPDSTVAKLSLDRMVSKYAAPQGGSVMYFTDREQAKAWLRSTPR